MRELKKVLRENGLSAVLGLLFLLAVVGQFVAGHAELDDELMEHGDPPVSALEYARSGHFLEALFENWESEFLQMALFVVLATRLYQKGSAESKSLDETEEVDRDPAQHRTDPDAPWPVRRGGWWLRLYKHSLSGALFALFALSTALHAVEGQRFANMERRQHGEPAMSLADYVTSSRFWFESMQNWQSEFLAVLTLTVLSIFLREQGSPQSKPVFAPHSETGK
jgi:hypothetical protein